MNKVKNEESIKPKIMEHPKARQVSSDKVIGIIPIIVQIEVMKIASILDLPASIIASIKGIPLRKLRLILSTRIIAFFTTIPNNARTPIKPGKERLTRTTAKPKKTPIKARGIVVKTTKTFLTELN